MCSTGEPAESQIPAETHPASVLSGVAAQAMGAGTMIHLQGDGSVENAVAFTLENPNRLVVDLPGLKNQLEKANIEVGSSQVARVRVGAHEDKVRVVVDGGSDPAPFDGRRVVPVPTGLVVALGSDPSLDAEVTAEVTPGLIVGRMLAMVCPHTRMSIPPPSPNRRP